MNETTYLSKVQYSVIATLCEMYTTKLISLDFSLSQYSLGTAINTRIFKSIVSHSIYFSASHLKDLSIIECCRVAACIAGVHLSVSLCSQVDDCTK